MAFFGGGGQNPADAAMPYFQQIPGMEEQYLNPYIQRGETAGNFLGNEYGQLAGDPTGYLASIMAKYQPSKNYELTKKELLRQAGNTAAAGGMRGSATDIANESNITNRLLQGDMQNWLANVLGIQREGLGGEQGLYGTGFQAARGLSGDLSNVLGTEGQLAFQGAREANQRKQDWLSSLLGGLGMVAGLPMGKDESLGGELGSSIGHWLKGIL